MSWSDRSLMQKFLLIVSIIAVCGALACLAANLTTSIKASTETWFVPCKDCKPKGDKECGKHCCPDGNDNCNTKSAAFFYILRIYSMIFCIMCVMSEIKALNWWFEYLKVLRFFWGRGLLHIFVGFLTVTGNVAAGNPDAKTWAEILGWIIISIGLLHIILSMLCFTEYSDEEKTKADPLASSSDYVPASEPAPANSSAI